MYAITLPSFGGPDALTWAEVPDPEPGPGEVLLDVVATAVNRADVMQRLGHYPPPPGAPAYPGLECSGRIAALGPGVTGWHVGDQVCALLGGGGYAERVAVPAAHLLAVPGGLSLVEAAALPEVTCTVWSNVFMLAGLAPGEVFLVHGGSSGIGTMAIQLAARHGARVFCTAGTEAKLARCRELGAEVAVNYREDDFVARADPIDIRADRVDGPGARRGPQKIERLLPVHRLRRHSWRLGGSTFRPHFAQLANTSSAWFHHFAKHYSSRPLPPSLQNRRCPLTSVPLIVYNSS